MKKNILTFFFSLFFSFLIIECFLRLFYPINLTGWYSEIIDKEKNFVALKKNHYHKNDRWNLKYNANYIFGEYRNRVTNHTNNKFNDKILILGDSFTFGIYLNDEDAYINKLQKKFSNFNFINSSTPGWGLEDYYLFTKKFCKIINPKKIIIILNDGDLGRIKKRVIIAKNQTKSLKERFIVYKILVENFMSIAFLRQNIYKLKDFNKKINKYNFEDTFIYFDKKDTEKIVKDSKLLFLKLKNEAKNCNASLHVINLGWSDYKKNTLNNPKALFFKKNSNFFQDHIIDFHDNIPFLREVHLNKHKYIIKNEGHPNELGSEKIFMSLLIHFNKILN